jgi:hypothetical protein
MTQATENVPNKAAEKQPKNQEAAPKAKKGDDKGLGKIVPQKTDLEPGSHKQVGYVTKNGVLFPVGFKFKGGHISSKGSVVLNVCPKCGHHQYPSQAVKGFCEQVHEKKGCGFDMIAELEEVQL